MIVIKLDEALGKRHMSQKRLAELVSARPNTICDLYNNRVNKLDIILFSKICSVLHCKVEDLLEYREMA